MPQAIERLFATPMMRPFLPAIRLPLATPALGTGSNMVAISLHRPFSARILHKRAGGSRWPAQEAC